MWVKRVYIINGYYSVLFALYSLPFTLRSFSLLLIMLFLFMFSFFLICLIALARGITVVYLLRARNISFHAVTSTFTYFVRTCLKSSDGKPSLPK